MSGRVFGVVIFCFAVIFVGMMFNRMSASTSYLHSRVQSIEVRLQEIEERMPAQPAPSPMEGGVR